MLHAAPLKYIAGRAARRGPASIGLVVGCGFLLLPLDGGQGDADGFPYAAVVLVGRYRRWPDGYGWLIGFLVGTVFRTQSGPRCRRAVLGRTSGRDPASPYLPRGTALRFIRGSWL